MTPQPDTAARDYRAIVEKVDRRYHAAALSTAPVLDAAAALLDAWCATAAEHGADMLGHQGGEWATRLAGAALEMAVEQVRRSPRPQTPDEATALLDLVAVRLAARGITTGRDVLYVALPRVETTPAWGTDSRRALAITIDIDRGWELVIDQPAGSPVVEIVGRCDETGIDAMLDLAITINTGVYGSLFRY